ncbi:regulatory factor X-associated protein-like [Antedon mediterranea]|uniref:regulatory factor X-associated protein-like n=1 Tax=Antedon mediterranea TaxID=105859 RepID=UPI003AF5027A
MAEQSCSTEPAQTQTEKAGNSGSSSSSDQQTCEVGECKEAAFRFKSGAWICRYHRNKGYKEKYKRKSKHIAAQAKMREQESTEETLAQLSGLNSLIDVAYPERQQYLADQIISDKKMALMQSPMVQDFLRAEQERLRNETLEKELTESV